MIGNALEDIKSLSLPTRSLVVQRLTIALAMCAAPTLAFAQTVTGGASPQTMINNVCTFLLGPFGQSIAVLAIFGIGALFAAGRASLGIIGSIVGGIILMFGASYLGAIITGGG